MKRSKGSGSPFLKFVGSETVENPKVDAFLEDIAAVMRRHDLALIYDGDYGNFEVWRMESDVPDHVMKAIDFT